MSQNATPISTLPELLAKLRSANKRTLTADEIAAQRASWVYGQLPEMHPMSKRDVAELLSRPVDGSILEMQEKAQFHGHLPFEHKLPRMSKLEAARYCAVRELF